MQRRATRAEIPTECLQLRLHPSSDDPSNNGENDHLKRAVSHVMPSGVRYRLYGTKSHDRVKWETERFSNLRDENRADCPCLHCYIATLLHWMRPSGIRSNCGSMQQ